MEDNKEHIAHSRLVGEKCVVSVTVYLAIDFSNLRFYNSENDIQARAYQMIYKAHSLSVTEIDYDKLHQILFEPLLVEFTSCFSWL